jgi:hypothetical protein
MPALYLRATTTIFVPLRPRHVLVAEDEPLMARMLVDYCMRPAKLSITHNFYSDHSAQRDISKA